MKVHTTNYKNTFIEIAEDCPTEKGEMPLIKGNKKSIANLQFEMLFENPYKYTSDEILFKVFAVRKDLLERDMEGERQNFFSKGQPCFRASPLTKRYGWGIHNNEEGKIAIYGAETKEYQKLATESSLKKITGMRSKRK